MINSAFKSLRQRLAAAITLSTLLPGNATASFDPAQAEEHINIRGIERTYRVYTPLSKRQPHSIVFVIHGGEGTGAGAERVYGMDEMADKYGFLAVYPDGIDRHWNDGRPSANPGIDDVEFIKTLTDDLSAKHNIKKRQVYACGISNGAMFSNYLALKIPERLGAIASIAGDIPVADAALRPAAPISVMLIHGVSDKVVPFVGGYVKSPIGGLVLSHFDTQQKWLQYNGGERKKTIKKEIPDRQGAMSGFMPTRITTPASIEISHTKTGAIVESVIVHNGGHTWPGHVNLALQGSDGLTAVNFDASQLIAEFFQQHGL